MINARWLIISVLLCLGYSPACLADFRGLPQINVMADSSMAETMTELIRLYSKEHNITVTASYDDTSIQAEKIADGESADIFITSQTHWMNDLKQKGLVDVYSITNLVKNRLVLAISSDNHLKDHPALKDKLVEQLAFLNSRMILVMADPDDTDLGSYSKQALISLGNQSKRNLWNKISNNIIRAANAKNALYLISHGDSAGIIYYSDGFNNPTVKILATFDSKLYDPIIYQAAVVAGENMTAARTFLDFLKSNAAKRIFHDHHFMID